MTHIIIALLDPPCEVLEPRLCEICGVFREYLSSCYISASLTCPGIAVFDCCAIRNVSGGDSFFSAVINEGFFVIPVHRRNVYRRFPDHPVTCRHFRFFIVLFVVYESGPGGIFARHISRASLILRSESVRQSRKSDALCLTVVRKLPVLLPSDCAHVELSLVDVPSEHHVREVVFVIVSIQYFELGSCNV